MPLSFRTKLWLTTAMIGSMTTYARRAYAACTPTAPGTYVCSGTNTTTQTINSNPSSATITTAAGFSVNAAAGDGIDLISNGGLSFNDQNSSTIRGATGIYQKNYNGGATHIITTGTVAGIGTGGANTGGGINAFNSFGATDLTITTGGAVSGGHYGVRALNGGSGTLQITSNGVITASNTSTGIGIDASNFGTDIIVTANAAVTGAQQGIYAGQSGSGLFQITATGAITGTSGTGIRAYNFSAGSAVTINARNVTGGAYGVYVRNAGNRSISITTTGTVSGGGAAGAGIQVYDSVNATNSNVTINAATVLGGQGINVVQVTQGTTSITTTSGVYGTSGVGIKAKNILGTGLSITAGTVRGSTDGIYAYTSSNASGPTTIMTSGTVSAGGYGIYLKHTASGAATISTSGNVAGTSLDAIHATTGTASTTLGITGVADAMVTGGRNGIYALHSGVGALTITSNGTVVGAGNFGIEAGNTGLGTDITIAGSGTAVGSYDGIYVRNAGKGATSIATRNAYGLGTSTTGQTLIDRMPDGSLSGIGILAYNRAAATGLTITTAAGGVVQGARDGIRAYNIGSGGSTITTNGMVTGGRYGLFFSQSGSGAVSIATYGNVIGTAMDAIHAASGTASSALVISTAANTIVRGGQNGLFAYHQGTGTLTVTSNATVIGQNLFGILAVNRIVGKDITVIASGSVTGGATGVYVGNSGNGGTTISTASAYGQGKLTGFRYGMGILAENQENTTGLTITTAAGGKVQGSYNGIRAVNRGSGPTMITTYGTVTGGDNGISLHHTGPGTAAIATYGTVTGTSANGIYATTGGSMLTISTAAGTTVTGGYDGIYAHNLGPGTTTISTGSANGLGTNAGTNTGVGILANNTATTTGLAITTAAGGTVQGATDGILAMNAGTGPTTITANGTVIGTGGSGIAVTNTGTGTTTIGVGANGLVEGSVAGISVDPPGAITIANAGTIQNRSGLSSALAIVTTGAPTTITNTGVLRGTVSLGDLGNALINGTATPDSGKWVTAGGTNQFGALTASNTITNQAGGTIVAGLSGATAPVTTTFNGLGTFTNAGLITMQNGIAGDRTVITGNFVGQNGVIQLDTVLGADNSPSDQLVLNGGSASGTTTLAIVNAGGTGAITTGDGILVVNAINGATTTATAFKSGVVSAGAFEYALYRGGIGADAGNANFYLRSPIPTPVPTPTPTPTPTPPPGAGPTPTPTPTPTPANASPYTPSAQTVLPYAAVLNTFANATVGTLQQREGDRVWVDPTLETGAWYRAGGQYDHVSRLGWGTNYTQGLGFMQGGYEHEAYADDRGALALGAFATVGTSLATLNLSPNPATGAARSGRINTSGYGLSGNATWTGRDGFYVDDIAQFLYTNSSMTSKAGTNDGFNTAFSTEIGRRFDLGTGLALVPQAQLVYAHAAFDGYTDQSGNAVRLTNGDSLTTRFGTRLERIDRWTTDGGDAARLQTYAIANLTYQILGDPATSFAGTTITQQQPRLWAEIGLGGDYSWTKNWSLHAEASFAGSAPTANDNLARSFDLKGAVGVKYQW